ncbi:hypothetical protein HER19_03915 [Rhizobium sp. BGM003]|nr:hypothetical protein [Rhizobium phaseoli]
MTSINTNQGAMAALRTLRAVSGDLTTTQQQVSTSLRVQKASDNAAYWWIATTMRSDKKAMSAVSDSISFAKAVLDTTYNGIYKVREELVTVRNLMITAQSLPPPATDGFSNWTDYQPGVLAVDYLHIVSIPTNVCRRRNCRRKIISPCHLTADVYIPGRNKPGKEMGKWSISISS